MDTTTILCIIMLSLYILLVVYWIVRSIIDAIDDYKRKQRDEKWTEQLQQYEKERVQREVEYHEARMKKLKEN
jgi:predicted Holliday junction resolvase-like endonuclease